jgi:hypothetical protein
VHATVQAPGSHAFICCILLSVWSGLLPRNPLLQDKHKVAPHQVLSILSWGKLNPGYTLLMYDNDDMLK